MYANDPTMARRWSKHTPKGKRLPDRVGEGLLAVYASIGLTTNEEILAYAATMGESALSEAQSALFGTEDEPGREIGRDMNEAGRENSTAMVVVPADPPGKNVCDFVRRVCVDRSKLIVVAQDGKLAPGNFERLLRASMPDCEKKLRVMDAGGSLADAVNSAERNRFYRPGQSLEVYATVEQARLFAQEIRDGSLKFDPTVITVHPQTVPSDELEPILAAVQGDDLVAMHRVLDPHIFSSPEGVPEYHDGLFGETGADIKSNASMKVKTEMLFLEAQRHLTLESLVTEFFTDIAPDKESGKVALKGVVQRNGKLLRDRGIDVNGAQYLGSGGNGSAWKLRDNRVLKVTTDDAEAHVAAHIKGKHFKHIFTIYDVWAFPGQINGHHIYGLTTEADLERPTEADRSGFQRLVDILEDVYEGSDEDLRNGDLRKVLQNMMAQPEDEVPANIKRLVLELVRRFDLGGMLADVKRLGYAADLSNAGNIMKRQDGTFVLIDIGTGGDQESQRAPFLDSESVGDIIVPTLGDRRIDEFGTGAPGSGANGPAQMRGSNSSSWSTGIGALKQPMQTVPRDENETERDVALDQDMQGTGLDWGPGRISGGSF